LLQLNAAQFPVTSNTQVVTGGGLNVNLVSRGSSGSLCVLGNYDGYNGVVQCFGMPSVVTYTATCSGAVLIADPASLSGVIAPLQGVVGIVTLQDAASPTVCAWTVSGTAACWGNSSYLGAYVSSSAPVGPSPVYTDTAGTVPLTNVQQMSGGGYHFCALYGISQPLSLACWGDNGNGALTGTYTPTVTMVASYSVAHTSYVFLPTSTTAGIIGVSSVLQLSAGFRHVCVLVNEVSGTQGAVRCWGQDGTYLEYLQSTYSPGVDVEYSNATTQQNGGAASITSLAGTRVRGVASISSGYHYTCAIMNSPLAPVSCWGNNAVYGLGNGGSAGTTSTHGSIGPPPCPSPGPNTFTQLIGGGVIG